MPRIQILELPTEHHGDDMITPFVLVIDQVPVDHEGNPIIDRTQRDLVAERVGARTVLVFEDTVEIPANWVAMDSDASDGGVVRLRVEPDLAHFREQVEQAAADAHRRLSDTLRATDQ